MFLERKDEVQMKDNCLTTQQLIEILAQMRESFNTHANYDQHPLDLLSKWDRIFGEVISKTQQIEQRNEQQPTTEDQQPCP